MAKRSTGIFRTFSRSLETKQNQAVNVSVQISAPARERLNPKRRRTGALQNLSEFGSALVGAAAPG